MGGGDGFSLLGQAPNVLDAGLDPDALEACLHTGPSIAIHRTVSTR